MNSDILRATWYITAQLQNHIPSQDTPETLRKYSLVLPRRDAPTQTSGSPRLSHHSYALSGTTPHISSPAQPMRHEHNRGCTCGGTYIVSANMEQQALRPVCIEFYLPMSGVLSQPTNVQVSNVCSKYIHKYVSYIELHGMFGKVVNVCLSLWTPACAMSSCFMKSVIEVQPTLSCSEGYTHPRP